MKARHLSLRCIVPHLLCLVLAGSAAAQATQLVPPPDRDLIFLGEAQTDVEAFSYWAGNGHLYARTAGQHIYWTARGVASRLGGYLASINSAPEQSWLFHSFPWHTDQWIGFCDETTEGVFRWDSGESSSYQNFAPGEPNDGQTPGSICAGEDYVAMWYNGMWNDVPMDACFGPIRGLVEIPHSILQVRTRRRFSPPIGTGYIPGHAYVRLIPGHGAEAGTPYTFGFFADAGIFSRPGRIDPACYPWTEELNIAISPSKCNELMAFIRARASSPPIYNLLNSNCVVFVIDVLDRAGVPITLNQVRNAAGVPDPNSLANLIVAAGGRSNPSSGSCEMNPPLMITDEDIRLQTLRSPGHVAGLLLLAYREVDLGVRQVAQGQPLELRVQGVDPRASVTMVDWGDGAESRQSTDLRHLYATPGRYELVVTIVDHGSENRWRAELRVGAAGQNAIDLTVLPSAPTTWRNSGFTGPRYGSRSAEVLDLGGGCNGGEDALVATQPYFGGRVVCSLSPTVPGQLGSIFVALPPLQSTSLGVPCEMHIDPQQPGAQLLMLPTHSPWNPVELLIPRHPALLAADIHLQGVGLAPTGFFLSNALKLRVGYR